MTNLVTQLRDAHRYGGDKALYNRAADEIERLRAGLERLRDALIESKDFVFAAMATETLRSAVEPIEKP